MDVKNVTQIDVLEQHNILLVMSDKTLFSYAIEALDPEESVNAQSKRGRKIGHANFFKVGIFEGQHLVCSVKPPGLAGASDIKIYKPESMPSGKKKSGLAKMLAGGQEVLKPYKVITGPYSNYIAISDINLRSSTFPPKLILYISSNLLFASDALGGMRLLNLRV